MAIRKEKILPTISSSPPLSFIRSYLHTENQKLIFNFLFFGPKSSEILLIRYTHFIPTMEEAYSEVIDTGTRTTNPMCKCGKRSRILTAFTVTNFGRRFYTCVNFVHGKRVVSRLFELHENLKNERAQIGTKISNEILKCKLEVAEYKAKMEVVSLTFEMQLQMQKNKFNSKETKYRFALACILILLVLMMFYPVSNANSSRLRLH
ncbi:hypothetical protein FH972_002369 [Carpinus fangiana]|uniref:Zinc finger GRF-type domain-containing protein n=1 Tax=Carpinus fangiana TaxID=176857 RepID=A0A5N6QF64_9ROSI|nr:hypothetical protein FH972_002369 [Carpinus fangiana]